ncbi:hypothetical protein CEXT_183011 [Caerostris extrusa]|uniref:Uncharacterized protein n=1 Tax=Caerostris extrusa TaxID=172846 RepID=A0AAV4W0Y8_CAEEX|nr:hypothetical protein CEXT_183011 [Caerostris extrusa]
MLGRHTDAVVMVTGGMLLDRMEKGIYRIIGVVIAVTLTLNLALANAHEMGMAPTCATWHVQFLGFGMSQDRNYFLKKRILS